MEQFTEQVNKQSELRLQQMLVIEGLWSRKITATDEEVAKNMKKLHLNITFQ